MNDLVLLHGWGMNNAVWGDWPAQLAAATALTVTPLALPGHGLARVNPPLEDLDAWVSDCLSRAPTRACWLGWSLGGLVALAAALRAPHRVTGLILIGTSPRFTAAVDWPHALQPTLLDQFQEQLIRDPAATLARFLALQVLHSEAGRRLLKGLRSALAAQPAPHPAALAAGLQILRTTDLRQDLSQLTVPSLWLLGRLDALVPIRMADDLPSHCPAATLHRFSEAAHTPFLSHPEETTAVVAAFCQRVKTSCVSDH
ncbi:Pimeloyl-(acyl-carrier protein) methyl ester esterase [Gammaproteobacteria bacterium]